MNTKTSPVNSPLVFILSVAVTDIKGGREGRENYELFRYGNCHCCI